MSELDFKKMLEESSNKPKSASPDDFFNQHFSSGLFDDILKNATANQSKDEIEIDASDVAPLGKLGDAPSFSIDELMGNLKPKSSTKDFDISFDDILGVDTIDAMVDLSPSKESEDSESNSFLGDEEVIDAEDFLLDAEQELANLYVNTSLIADFVYTDIHALVEEFLHTSSNTTLKRKPYNTTIQKIIKSKYSVPALQTLYDILNISANRDTLTAEHSKAHKELTAQKAEVIQTYTKDKDRIVGRVQNYVSEDTDSVTQLFDAELGRMTTKKIEVESQYDTQKSAVVNAELSKRKDLFAKTEKLSKEVKVIQKRIKKLLGSNYGSYKESQIVIPETEEELAELIERTEASMEGLELNDKSYYNLFMKKLFKILFYPTTLFSGDIRMIVLLVNTLVVFYFAVRFRNIAVLAFSASILVDIVFQIQMASKNSDAEFAIEFASKSDAIIQAIRNNLVSGATQANEKEKREMMARFDKRIHELTNQLRSILDEKVKEIRKSSDRNDLVEKIDNKYARVLEALELRSTKMGREIDSDFVNARKNLDTELEKLNKMAGTIEQEDFLNCDNKMQLVFKPKAKVGDLTASPEAKITFTRNFSEGSFMIKTKTVEEKTEVFGYVKHITLQLLNTMRPEYLTVNFIDVENMGNDFMELISENEGISKLLPNDEMVTEHISGSVKEIEKRYKQATKDFKSVTEYNESMASKKAVTLKYQLNIFYNFNVELVKNLKFRTLMSEGGKSGFTNVVIFTDSDFKDQKGELKQDIVKGLDCFDFQISCDSQDNKWKLANASNAHLWKGSFFPAFEHLNQVPISYSRDEGLDKIRYLEEVAKNSKLDMLLYEELENKYAPEIFQKNTLTGIEICAGFRDGDLTRPEFVEIGDSSVHALMGGMTGAGKSNTINIVLMNLIRSYSPEWLELVMIDFKNVEFSFYTETIETKNYKKKICELPHTSMIAGTKDAEYSLSVFETILDKMDKRKKFLSNGIKHKGEFHTFKKIEEYNRFVLKEKITREFPIIPRILVMLDEFQVMFTIDDDEVISTIKMYIQRLSKEARAMGVHMFFTSQSMEGTLSEDIKNQFVMRWCLAASADTSKELIGNAASSTLPPRGFVYMNQSTGREETANRLYRVPFIPSDYIKKTMHLVNKESKRLHEENPNIPFHAQEFYDEESLHAEKELKAYLNAEAIKNKRNAILLGQKVVYKPKSVPENFMIGNDDMENIAVTGNDKLSTANIINTLLENYASKERTRILIANFDRTLDGYLRENLGHPSVKVFNRVSDALPIFETMQDIIGEPIMSDFDPTEEELEPSEYNPDTDNRWIVFLVGLHKAQGFNEAYIEDEFKDPLLKLLKLGPSKGITTILNFKPPSRLTSLLPQCAYRISAKVDDDLSYELFNNKKGKNLVAEDNMAFGLFRSTVDDKMFKFKIYNFDYDSKLLKPKEIEDVVI